jgi:hypothetical protein
LNGSNQRREPDAGRTRQGAANIFEPTREPFLSGPHQDGMDATKAVPNQKDALTAILDPEKEMLK